MVLPSKSRKTEIRNEVPSQSGGQGDHLQTTPLLPARRRKLREIWNRSRKRNPTQRSRRLRENLPHDFDAKFRLS